MYELAGKMASAVLIIGILAGVYGVGYIFIFSNVAEPELNRAQALLTNAKGSTNLIFMAEQLEASVLVYADKKGNAAWVVQTSWTDYDSIRADTITVAKYCRELQAKLEGDGALPSGDYTYYSQAIERIQTVDIHTLQHRISDSFICETTGSQTAFTQIGIFIIIWVITLCLLGYFGGRIDNWGEKIFNSNS